MRLILRALIVASTFGKEDKACICSEIDTVKMNLFTR